MDEELDGKLETEADQQPGEQANEAPCKPGAFVKGDPRINRTDGPAGKKRKPNRALRDMRAVYEQDESKDRGPAQKQLRKMFKEDIGRFVARMDRLEHAHEKAEGKQQVVMPEPVEEVDEPLERMIAFAKLLQERPWEKKQ